MQKNTSISRGIDRLLADFPKDLTGGRAGLISHPASVNAQGVHSAELLRNTPHLTLACLLSPEHGYFGGAPAGEKISSEEHPEWEIPIHSLYGEHRKPSAEMLENIDVLIYDMQGIAVRCYTYGSTLKLALEAAAEEGVSVIIADQPDPLSGIVDGPILQPGYESFVSSLPSPYVYGLTPGETALWLRNEFWPDLDLRVIPCASMDRNDPFGTYCDRWIPPSPGIRSLQSALTYPITVVSEAIPALDCWRSGLLPFQVIGAPFIEAEQLCSALNKQSFPGLEFHPTWYRAAGKPYDGKIIGGARLSVTSMTDYQPTSAMVKIVSVLQNMYGLDTLWEFAGTREAFFDQLLGTDTVRIALQQRTDPDSIISHWQRGLREFREIREQIRLY